MIINGERIKQAREYRGWTQEDLANRVQASQPHISLIEQGAEAPSEGLMQGMALALGFPLAFFQKPSSPDFPMGSLLYRKSKAIHAAGAAELRQSARLVLDLVVELGSMFKPIPVSVPREGNPADAAQLARSALGVSPDGPVSGLVRKLEKAGVLVVYLPKQTAGFDAFSAWTGEDPRRPVICLTRRRSGDRIRKTLAHELGHLVMHQDFLGSQSERDEDAELFAAEFLFPEVAMQSDIHLPLTLTQLAGLKRRWGVSMAAIAYFAELRGLITRRQKQYIRAKLAQKNWLEREPVEIPVEAPRLIRQMLEAVAKPPFNARKLAKRLTTSATFIEQLLEVNAPGNPDDLADSGPDTMSKRQAVSGGASVIEFRSNSASK